MTHASSVRPRLSVRGYLSRVDVDSPASLGRLPAALGEAEQPVLDLVPPLRRFVAARIDQPQDIDDVVQETLARVLAARERLDDESLTAYAITVARNLLAARHREQLVARNHAPKLVDLREPHRPEESVLAAEDRRALATALETLPPDRRATLLEHVLDERPLSDLPGSPPSLAAQLGRTRARLRVDYLLALRQVTPATPRCRPVLLAVSAGDVRRQRALRAGPHLLHCPTCSQLGEPLLQRRRALAGVVPWLPLGALHGHLERLVRQHPVPSIAAAGSAGLVIATAMAASVIGHSAAPPAGRTAPSARGPSAMTAPPAQDDSTLTSARGSLPTGSTALRGLAGDKVIAQGARVLGVPADEGFWVANSDGKVWVQLRHRASESPVQIRPRQRIWFDSVVVRHDASFARSVGLNAGSDERELTRQQAHLLVEPGTVRVDS